MLEAVLAPENEPSECVARRSAGRSAGHVGHRIRRVLPCHNRIKAGSCRGFSRKGLSMRRINQAATLVAIGCAFSNPAVGQDDCLSYFKINPSKSMTYVWIDPTAGDRIDATMSCSIAGNMRDEFFSQERRLILTCLVTPTNLGQKFWKSKCNLPTANQGWSKL